MNCSKGDKQQHRFQAEEKPAASWGFGGLVVHGVIVGGLILDHGVVLRGVNVRPMFHRIRQLGRAV